MVGKRTFTGRSPVHDSYTNGYARDGDLESGPESPGPRFKDAINLAMADQKRAEITDKLKAGPKQEDFKKYYTPQKEVRLPQTSRASFLIPAAARYYQEQEDQEILRKPE